VFTFLLILDPIMDYAEALLSRGVPPLTVARLILTLVPQALGIAIPVAVLVGLLDSAWVGFRRSRDRRLAGRRRQPVPPPASRRAIAGLAGAVTLWVMVLAIPDANQTFREITFSIIAQKVQEDIHPGLLRRLPCKVLYVRDAPESGRAGTGVPADTSRPGWPTV